MKSSNVEYSVFKSLERVMNASSHDSVTDEVRQLVYYVTLCHVAHNGTTLSAISWNNYFGRYPS